jgi:hypothetical protein
MGLCQIFQRAEADAEIKRVRADLSLGVLGMFLLEIFVLTIARAETAQFGIRFTMREFLPL